ncbi:4-hydroxybenzoate octaprenyltransferase [Porticoccus sp.]|uniref:4-hydroxybenzoate octaprenyltransferase n=1 Tax=Porticoccus sp. TaxID=2024853 RepID=UPI003F69D717
MNSLLQRLPDFVRLMRFDKPIGTLLLLWPTLWALWLAAGGVPSAKNLLIFVPGVILMRAAGCVINDVADRQVDGHVTRTRHRPLPSGTISVREAMVLFVLLCLIAFALVLLTNPLTIKLALVGVALAACYPFMKRFTHLPQLVLGAAFAWSLPMAFAAESNGLPREMWTLYIAVVLWTVAYDTFYAMVDRDDDIKIGIKSTAILFGDMDIPITACLQCLVLIALLMTGVNFGRGGWFFLSLLVTALLFLFQQYLIRHRERDACFRAFLNNHYVGAIIFIGLVADYQLTAD